MEHPKGTLTLLFTDIQGSTELWEKLGNKFKDILNVHDKIMRDNMAGLVA